MLLEGAPTVPVDRLSGVRFYARGRSPLATTVGIDAVRPQVGELGWQTTVQSDQTTTTGPLVERALASLRYGQSHSKARAAILN